MPAEISRRRASLEKKAINRDALDRADGNTAVVGGTLDNGQIGATRVFTRSNGGWAQQAKLVGSGVVGYAEQGLSVDANDHRGRRSVANDFLIFCTKPPCGPHKPFRTNRSICATLIEADGFARTTRD
jgi:hypothetical protein